ncbi:cyclin-dependent kinase inhibitor 3 family protein [Enterovibrio paralichthyis]|uniref:cyclin-dependent kinase inhibitor 3 family protein n=1 Tax=Enterovibrio paralichthyis TaxID=2853805 RepID=UPI001C48B132|nr:cyclin-dependent kinase inhibitor 3 family protein [Enterovibrio paralichthyis]MBV7299519.1 cyclin-dependent kinase inhibitor 3 family protein [Enterovibrio paralichthyis]
MTHPTWELELEGTSGLVLTPCPGTKGTPLTDSIEQLKAQGVAVLVTALSQHELDEAGVSSLPEEAENAGLTWFNTPIEDDCAPDEAFHSQWKDISPSIHQALDNGGKVALHCMGGSGRTGLLAAHILLEKGWSLSDIVPSVQALRPGAFTKAPQIDYINQFANQYYLKAL